KEDTKMNMSPLSSWQRALVYGAIGVNLEIIFTALKKKKSHLEGNTHLWSIPIYAAGGMTIEFLRKYPQFRNSPVIARLFAYTIMSLAIEYTAGYILKKGIGKCPWEYTGKYNVHGLITLDYSFIWAALGYVGERAIIPVTKSLVLQKNRQ